MTKKMSIALIATIAVLGITPAQAQQQESIAIIDGYFDAALIDGSVQEVCVVSASACSRVSLPKADWHYRNFNHGTIMADIVRANNPNANLILIRAATVTTNTVTGFGLEAALDWVAANRNTYNIKKVSFSYNVGNGATCLPSAAGLNARVMHSNIVEDVSNLLQSGTRVFAAAGNHSARRIDYPACISDVVSVGSNLFRGSMQLSDIVHSGFTYTSNVLKSNVASLQDSNIISRTGVNQVRVGNTTSVATAIVAATN